MKLDKDIKNSLSRNGRMQIDNEIFEEIHFCSVREKRHTTWTIHTHNILAQTWIDWGEDLGLGWYGKEILESGFLNSKTRLPKVFRKAQEAQADVICFQEVGETELRALKSHRLSEEFEIFWVPNAVTCAKEANGVATLVHRKNVEVVRHDELQFGEQTGASLLSCRKNGTILSILNVHLDGPECIEEPASVYQVSALMCFAFETKSIFL